MLRVPLDVTNCVQPRWISFSGIVVSLGCADGLRRDRIHECLADVPELLEIAFVDDVDALGKPVPKAPAYDLQLHRFDILAGRLLEAPLLSFDVYLLQIPDQSVRGGVVE